VKKHVSNSLTKFCDENIFSSLILVFCMCLNYFTKNDCVIQLFQAASFWIYVYPRGLRDLLLYTKNKYNNPAIFITENGKYTNTSY
jgi:hypothetical protein